MLQVFFPLNHYFQFCWVFFDTEKLKTHIVISIFSFLYVLTYKVLPNPEISNSHIHFCFPYDFVLISLKHFTVYFVRVESMFFPSYNKFSKKNLLNFFSHQFKILLSLYSFFSFFYSRPPVLPCIFLCTFINILTCGGEKSLHSFLRYFHPFIFPCNIRNIFKPI